MASVGMLILILDARTALAGAQDGIELCIKTVIPSLFPFFLLSSIIRNTFVGKPIKVLRPLGKMCSIPEGAESLLLLGMVGGYPVGAQGIHDAYESGALTKSDAQRMLGFCNNAGPAFIFGMIGSLFSSALTLWVLWGIHILSALVVGMLLAPKNIGQCHLKECAYKPIAQTVESSIKTTANVCGWVIVFRVVVAFCQHWFFWLLPIQLQAALVGVLELSNGCYTLQGISAQGTRFVLCAATLAFGGICVAMQTVSVTKGLGTGMYFPGKTLQAVISFLLAETAQLFLFKQEERCPIPAIAFVLALSAGAATLFMINRKKKALAILC